MELNFSNLYHRRFENKFDGRQVILIGVAHIWPQYGFTRLDEVLNKYRSNGFTVFHEGVRPTENPGRLEKKLSTAMQEFYASFKSIEPEFVFQKNQESLYDWNVDIKADVDFKEFTRSLGIVKSYAMAVGMKLGSKLSSSITAEEMAEMFDSDSAESMALLKKLVGGTLLDLRNEHAIALAVQADKAVLPWGMAHLEGMAEILEFLGFEQVEELDESILKEVSNS